MNRQLCSWIAIPMALLGGAALLRAQTYTFSTFTVSGAAPATNQSLGVQDINNAGVINGWLIDTSNATEAWQRGVNGNITVYIDPLNTGTPSYTAAYGINNEGVSVGIFTDTAAGNYPGYFYTSKGQFVTFNLPDQPAGTATFLEGINDHAGQYCGSIGTPPDYNYETFFSFSGKNQIIAVNGSTNSGCASLNDQNAAVGYYEDSNGVDHGWLYNPSTGLFTTIDVPGAATVPGTAPCWGSGIAGTVVIGINNKGMISGHYWDTSYNSHGFVRTPGGKYYTINVPGAYETGGGGINDNGVVVGHYSDSACNNSGYIATPN